jgi:hypothetical protein
MCRLVGIVKNSFRKALIVVSLAGFMTFYGCHKPDPDVPDNYAPVAFTKVTPPAGEAPLSTRIEGFGTDKDGVADITLYTVNIDGKDTTGNSPFDFVKVFTTPGTHKVYTIVKDSKGATNKSDVVSVNVNSQVFSAPVASLNVSATYGTSPLTVRMKASGTDKDNDISTYVLYLDGEVLDSLSRPVDTTMTFRPGTHTVSAQVFDKKRLNNKTSNTTINIDQTNDFWNNGMPLPKGKVNFFVSSDSTAEYNTFPDQSGRDNYLSIEAVNDICARIPIGVRKINGVDYGFLCVPSSSLFEYNSHDWEDLYDSDRKIYGWYKGENIDSIYVHGGTIKFRRSHNSPVFTVQISPVHLQNYAFTGNSLSSESVNFIEAAVAKTKLKSGQEGVPTDYPDLRCYFSFTYKDDLGHDNYGNVPAIAGDFTSGVEHFTGFNPNLDIIMTRDDRPVGINVNSPIEGKEYAANSKILLDEIVTSGTDPMSAQIFRYGYYSLDGGVTKTKIRQREHMDLIYENNRYFKPGNYTLIVYAKNEFFKDINKQIHFTVK